MKQEKQKDMKQEEKKDMKQERQKHMGQEKQKDIAQKSVRKRMNLLLISSLVLAAIFIIYITLINRQPLIVFKVGISIWLVVILILMNVAEPFWLHLFEHMTPERKAAYLKMLLLDIAGYGGIMYFLFQLGEDSRTGIYGALIYVIVNRFRRRFKDEFYGEDSNESVEELQKKEENTQDTKSRERSTDEKE
jgi:cation transport ATPase